MTSSTTRNPHSGNPQHLRCRRGGREGNWTSCGSVPREVSLGPRRKVGGSGQDVPFCCLLLLLTPLLAAAGGGNAASMSDKPDGCFSRSAGNLGQLWMDSQHARRENGQDIPPRSSFSGSEEDAAKSSSEPKRLAGLLPLSKLAASCVARRIKSGRLVKLPLASAWRTLSISNFGGRRMADSRLYRGLGGCGDPGAPLYSAALAALYAFKMLSAVRAPPMGVFTVGAVPDELEDASPRNDVTVLIGEATCSGSRSGARLVPTVLTSKALPLLPMLALRTKRLSSPSSSGVCAASSGMTSS
jgi:hypothetical protein